MSVLNFVKIAIRCCNRSKLINNLPRSIQFNGIHTTKSLCDLMEFFDIKDNWGENNVRVGRGWQLDELRIKSNTDLHKLWYILLKERNMLYTMEEECNRQIRHFPNPERIDKVQNSMNNIEIVVRERNEAYFQLETGETGERPSDDVVNLLGLPEKYNKVEYHIPKQFNTKWVRSYLDHGYINRASVKKFYRLMKEKENKNKLKETNRNNNHVIKLLSKFPDMDLDILKAEYPDVNIERAMRSRKARGHHDPKY